jgi:hypothetical protein
LKEEPAKSIVDQNYPVFQVYNHNKVIADFEHRGQHSFIRLTGLTDAFEAFNLAVQFCDGMPAFGKFTLKFLNRLIRHSYGRSGNLHPQPWCGRFKEFTGLLPDMQ